LSEIGADGPQQAAWISSLPALFDQHPRVAGFIWFNTSPATTGATGNYEFDRSTTSLDAFRSMIRKLQPAGTASPVIASTTNAVDKR
jgi:hypothetical protein